MSGVEDFNFPAFEDAAKELRNAGWEIVTPHELDDPEEIAGLDPNDVPEEEWLKFILRDLAIIGAGGFDAIICLPGWRESRGAQMEVCLGRQLGLRLLEYPMLFPIVPPAAPAAEVYESDDGSVVVALDDEEEDEGDEYGAPDGEVRVVNERTGGAKGRKKARMELLPWGPLMKVAELYAAGAAKYDDNNWMRGYDWSLSFGAMMRHAALFWQGEDDDEETGCSHMTAVVFHALALIYYAEHFPDLDDRPHH